ncbi:hypothetical protein QE358_003084 [Sphingomonas sp. SORGH_AS742]|nr:hypothetical protein [Sphingomonas sp. SORGH_AS_0742]
MTWPVIQATAVVTTIPISIAPRTFQMLSIAISNSPSSASAAPGSVNGPSVTSVAGLATTIPAFLSPMKPMNSPIPPATAANRCDGITETISCRTPVSVRIRKQTPEISTHPSATGQGMPICWTTVKLK